MSTVRELSPKVVGKGSKSVARSSAGRSSRPDRGLRLPVVRYASIARIASDEGDDLFCFGHTHETYHRVSAALWGAAHQVLSGDRPAAAAPVAPSAAIVPSA